VEQYRLGGARAGGDYQGNLGGDRDDGGGG
jgi:hypothetical protein